MRTTTTWLATLLLAGSLGVGATPLWAEGKETQRVPGGVISRVEIPGANYCNLRFPAIHRDTLFTDHPVLQDPDTKDVVDFYGSCDHDPLGEKEVRQQREDYWRDQRDRNR